VDDDGLLRPAPETFDTKFDAETWLDRVADGQPVHRVKPSPKFADYASQWLKTRELKPRTRAEYEAMTRKYLVPEFGPVRLDNITSQHVRDWHAQLLLKAPTARAHTYALLRNILATAESDDLLLKNPCRVRGAATAKRKSVTKVATVSEIDAIVEAMPPRYRAMVLLAAWCGLRFGELIALERRDIDPLRKTVRVDRGAVRVRGTVQIGSPKSEAGKRTVAIPPHVMPALQDHLATFVGHGPHALVFAAAHGGVLAPSTLYSVFYPARKAAGRPDLRFHDLRHTGATLAAATGATLADLMQRLGHSTAGAAMRYQHSAQDRDAAIAVALSKMALGEVVELKPRDSEAG
jgi:integrase